MYVMIAGVIRRSATVSFMYGDMCRLESPLGHLAWRLGSLCMTVRVSHIGKQILQNDLSAVF